MRGRGIYAVAAMKGGVHVLERVWPVWSEGASSIRNEG